jgi:hypothetical protein
MSFCGRCGDFVKRTVVGACAVCGLVLGTPGMPAQHANNAGAAATFVTSSAHHGDRGDSGDPGDEGLPAINRDGPKADSSATVSTNRVDPEGIVFYGQPGATVPTFPGNWT